jgi:hypothetical protein
MTDMYLYVSDMATKIDGAKRFSFEGIWNGPAEVRSLSGNGAPCSRAGGAKNTYSSEL